MKKIQLSLLAVAISVLVCHSLGLASQNTEEYWIKVNPTVTGRYTVDVDIQTSIKKPVLLAVDLRLVGRKFDDIAIGTNLIKVPIKDGSGTITIDGAKNPTPSGLKLPGGTYSVRATLYPNWEENKKIAKKLGINDSIEVESSVHLRASGALDESFIKKLEGQQWVMENVKIDMPWDRLAWEAKFGGLEDVGFQGSGNPNVLKMYYFKSIDMTLMVNALLNNILAYRMGLQHS